MSHKYVTNPSSEEFHHKTEVSRIQNIISPQPHHQKMLKMIFLHTSTVNLWKMKVQNLVSPEKLSCSIVCGWSLWAWPDLAENVFLLLSIHGLCFKQTVRGVILQWSALHYVQGLDTLDALSWLQVQLLQLENDGKRDDFLFGKRILTWHLVAGSTCFSRVK